MVASAPTGVAAPHLVHDREPLLLFHVELELTEGYVPLLGDQVERPPRFIQPLPLQLPETLLATPASSNQTCPGEYPQVLCNSLPRNAGSLRQPGDGHRSSCESRQQAEPVVISQRGEQRGR